METIIGILCGLGTLAYIIIGLLVACGVIVLAPLIPYIVGIALAISFIVSIIKWIGGIFGLF